MVGSANITVDSHHHQHHHPPMNGVAGDHQPPDSVDEDEPSSSGVSCSICLDTVSENGGRSIAKLQCGHEFHLDCIGSAFNMKGAMQCPNCRKIEKGQWLYANGSARTIPEMSMDDWIPDDDFYDIGYSEMPYRFHWCPFGDLVQVGSSFEEVESPSTTYHDLRGHHSLYAENAAASSAAHSYVALVGPLPSNVSRSNDSIDDPNFNQQWNGLSGRQEILSAHAFPAINIQYHSWGHHSPPYLVSSGRINGVDPVSIPLTFRSSNGETDARTRPTSFLHPILFGHGSGPTAGNSFVSSIIPRHPGSSARTHGRIQISHAVYHRHQAIGTQGIPWPIIHGVRRFDGPRGLPMLVPAPSQNDHGGGFLVIPQNSSGQNPQEAENPLPNQFHAWERDPLPHLPHVSFDGDSNWVPFGPNPGNRPSSFWHRHTS